PAAVVAHADAVDPAAVDLHLDAPGAGVEGVLDQFFDDAGGAFDHLTGGDPRGYMRGQHLDARARRHRHDAPPPGSRASGCLLGDPALSTLPRFDTATRTPARGWTPWALDDRITAAGCCSPRSSLPSGS